MSGISLFPPERRTALERPLRIVGGLGAAAMAASAFMSWSYDAGALDDLSVWGNPSTLQWHIFGIGLLVTALFLVPLVGVRLGNWRHLAAWNAGARSGAIGLVATAAITTLAIAVEAGGLVNVNPGAWVGLAGSVVALVCGALLPPSAEPDLGGLSSPAWVQIVVIGLILGAALFAAVYALALNDPGSFFVFVAAVVTLIYALVAWGAFGWLAVAVATRKRVFTLAAFVTAFALPFTQNGSDANMSVASQVVIFSVTALGLNIVVGLVGLLDLGYIAFLGAGAYTAAVLSPSLYATIHWTPPFWVAALISGTVASLFGLLIGTPTLRVSGDYLAIVTLAFGEIFRITMNNLDGRSGPDLTHGPNGIFDIPNLNFFGFDFGQTHVIFGVPISRFSNYFWLLLLLLALVIVVFTNLNRSRIGRGWVAIREDELAADAMGVNTFGLKLLAFAGGAFLAGLAGSVKAYLDVSVTPENFVFLESSFLLAAVVLGGMGTVSGVLIGAAILKILPEKLRFFSDYRLLFFGLLMVFMMRFRPEGIIADERRQLEFHGQDEELAEDVEEELIAWHSHYNPEPKGADRDDH